MDFREHIQASRVSREADLTPNPEYQKNIPGLFEASIEDVPQCLKVRYQNWIFSLLEKNDN